jgi:chorismate mutase
MTAKLNIESFEQWIGGGSQPLVISGPCSAEYEDQVVATAHAVARIPGVKIFRAGIWKPRTRPGTFEGVGEPGLAWMQRAKKETGLQTAVEVASPKHIEAALAHDIDILWIGARTVVNPFSLQELTGALKGLDVPVMVKNPVNPDLELWIGALERFNLAGIRKLAAVHRGFYFFDRSPYRNAPMWEIPIELKRRFPNLPVICDPSHICGERSMLQETAQKALDLDMDGVMIEAHIDPDNALSDPLQQVTPQELERIVTSLKVRAEKGSIEFQSKLEELRSEIDKIDAELMHILARRMEVVDEIGNYKRENNITVLQLNRWNEILRDRLRMGTRQGMPGEFIQYLLEIIHTESIRRQTELFHGNNNEESQG